MERKGKPKSNTISRRRFLGAGIVFVSGAIFRDGFRVAYDIGKSGETADKKLKQAVVPGGEMLVGVALGAAAIKLLEK